MAVCSEFQGYAQIHNRLYPEANVAVCVCVNKMKTTNRMCRLSSAQLIPAQPSPGSERISQIDYTRHVYDY